LKNQKEDEQNYQIYIEMISFLIDEYLNLGSLENYDEKGLK
jgi:hypothetical protein